MPVMDIEKDLPKAKMTIVSEFDAGVDRVWELWSDPRLLEKWWGPPGYPATVVDHELSAGGVVTYYMTSPEGDKFWGRWDVKTVEGPNLLEVEDSFAEEGGKANADMPSGHMRIEIEAIDGAADRTRMTVISTSASPEDLAKVLEMGQEEGMRQSFGQIDALL